VQEATYFALDRNGNSSTANNKGPGYIPLPADDGGASALIFSPTTPSASGWYLVQPTVTVAGAGAGYKVQVDASGTPVASATVTDGAHTVFAIDPGGHIVNSAQALVDTADPVLGTAPNVAAGAAGPSGARVDYPLPTATDNVDPAPAVTCSPASGTTFPIGTTTVSCTATDRAGRTSAQATFTVTVDGTPPVVTPSVTGTLGANGWYTGTVTVSFTVSDPDTPVTGTTGCGTSTVSTDTTGTTFSCTATSLGGSRTESVTVKRDATAPVVTCPTSPTYAIGQVGATLTASVADVTSGTPTATVSSPVQTAAAGAGSVTLTATDNAGNAASKACAYLVGYGLGPSGFLSPAPNSKWKTGQTVPIKIQVTGAGGQLISDAEANALVAASNCRLKFSVTGAQSLAPTCMSYDANGKLFQFNWKLGSKGTGDATITVTITYPGTTLVTSRSEVITITV